MFLTCLIFLFSFFMEQSYALDLLNIPFGQDEKLTYSVNQIEECGFKGIKQIEAPEFFIKKEGAFVVNTLNYFEKKINFNIDQYEITDERILFSLTGSTNIYFEFYFDKNCKLTRLLKINDRVYNLDKVNIEIKYKDSLASYVLEKIIINDKDNKFEKVSLYPWSLRGQMSTYEFNIGPALNIHTNIRLNDQNKFNKNNPVIEPIPAFFLRYGPLFLNKNGLGSLLFNKGEFSVVGMGLLEGEPYQGINLNDRTKGVFIGTILKYHFAELTYYQDFFDNKGMNLKLNLAPEYLFRMNWKFSPQLYIQYWDNKYMDYYYEVTSNEAIASSLKQYNPKNTFNAGYMLELTHYSGKWTFLASTGAKFYGKQVYKSPTVLKEVEGRLILSVLYKVF